MSASENLHLLDFNSPRRPSIDAVRQLSSWQGGVCAVVQETWGALLAQPISLAAGAIEPQQLRSAFARLPEDGLAVSLTLGAERIPSILVFSARQVQGLVADLLDLPGESWPAPRRLSPAEEAMLELLFQKFAEALGEAWPGSAPLPCQFVETAPRPQRSRAFPQDSALLAARMKLTSRFGEEVCHWLMLKEETERLIYTNLGDIPSDDREFNHNLVALAERVPLPVVVQLGTVDLSMSQVEQLSVGDVLMLDQFVNRPLVASVQGEPKWAGMPLRIGSRQAFEITHVIESDTNVGMLIQS